MKLRLLWLPLLAIPLGALSSCGYDGHFRYSCQDPENWENEECVPPKCKVTGTCTADILGWTEEDGA